MKSSHAALAVVGLALAGLWYAGGGSAVLPQNAAAAEARVSAPVAHDNLTVFFIHGPDAITNAKIATLEEALKAGWAVVHETGDVNSLAVENLSSEYELFIQEGDMIRGGRQDRMIATDMLVPPRSGRVPFPAHCVESGRRTGRGGEAATHFTKSDQFAVGNDLRYANATHQQSEVWANVAEQQRKLSDNLKVKVNAPESESSLQLALENRAVQAKVAEFEQALRAAGETRPNVIGVVFVVNGQMYGHEKYGSNALFLKAWPKLLKSQAANAVAEKTAKATPPAPSVREVERFLAYSERAQYDAGTRGPIDLGTIPDGVSNGPATDYGQALRDVQRVRVQTEDVVARRAGRTAMLLRPLRPRTAQSWPERRGANRRDATPSIRGSWSGQGPQDARSGWRNSCVLPAKYRPMVEEYFRQLERMSGQTTSPEIVRALGAIRREQIRDAEQGLAANPRGNAPTGGRPDLRVFGSYDVSGLGPTVSNAAGGANRRGDARPSEESNIPFGLPSDQAGFRVQTSVNAANPEGNRLNVNRVNGSGGLVTESRDPSRQNAVVHKSIIILSGTMGKKNAPPVLMRTW